MNFFVNNSIIKSPLLKIDYLYNYIDVYDFQIINSNVSEKLFDITRI